MTKSSELPRDIYNIWIQQQNYNQFIKQRQQRSKSEWMINYILGAISELSELLEQTKWKYHRITGISEFGPNIDEELADITKYVFSMWQLAGHTPQTMLDEMYQKGEILDQLYKQETREEPSGEQILMLDLDGCIADFREGFQEWLLTSEWIDSLPLESKTSGIHLDINNGWDYNTYNEAKIEFEAEGGYNTLPPCTNLISTVKHLQSKGWYVIVHTARPYTVYRRIWIDTWKWLLNNGLCVDELHFGHDTRITTARKLSIHNTVVAIEDDPTLILRYVACNIPTLVVHQSYNQGIPALPLIHHLMGEESSLQVAEYINTFFRSRSRNDRP